MSAQSYEGGCHCGTIRYTAEVDVEQSVSCNCSRCSKLGAILTFAPVDKFQLLSGSDSDLTDYLFNKHVIHHLFCSKCGIESFARGTRPDGAEMVAINVRCLDGVDADGLRPQFHDGKSS